MPGPYQSSTALMDCALEPGDRLEVLCDGPNQLQLPETWIEPVSIHTLDDEKGRTLSVSLDPASRLITVPDLSKSLPEFYSALWLEYREPGRFRLVVEPMPPNYAAAE